MTRPSGRARSRRNSCSVVSQAGGRVPPRRRRCRIRRARQDDECTRHSSGAPPASASGRSRIRWKLRFHAASRSSPSNIATPSPILSKVTRNSAWRWRISFKQPGIVHRDHRLRGEILQQRDLLVGERPHLARGAATIWPSSVSSLRSGTHSSRAHPAKFDDGPRDRIVDLRQIGNVDEPLTLEQCRSRASYGPSR